MTRKREGNSAFFKLAVELKKAGMGDLEIEAALSDEAQYAHSPAIDDGKFRASWEA